MKVQCLLSFAFPFNIFPTVVSFIHERCYSNKLHHESPLFFENIPLMQVEETLTNDQRIHVLLILKGHQSEAFDIFPFYTRKICNCIMLREGRILRLDESI